MSQVLVAEALRRELDRDPNKERQKLWKFTCNTDGGGIMRCSLREEYLLSLRVAQDFIKGGPETTSVLSLAKNEDIKLLLDEKVLGPVAERELVCLQTKNDDPGKTWVTCIKSSAFSEKFREKMERIINEGFALNNNHAWPRLAGGMLDR